MLDNQGILTGGGARYATNQKPISIEVTKNGIICCEIIPVGYVEQKGPILAGGDGVYVGDSYYIYPVGIEMGEYIYAYDEYGYEVTSYIGPDYRLRQSTNCISPLGRLCWTVHFRK